jgi:hypothetical protein
MDDVAEGQVSDQALYFWAVRAFAYQDVVGFGELCADPSDAAEEDVGALIVGKSADPAYEQALGRGEMAK